MNSLNGEERAMTESKILRFIKTLKEIRSVLPHLKKLFFELFWIVFAIIEMIRFLKSLF
jgi:hypothetical protein